MRGLALAVFACASCASFELVELPRREADVYPSADVRQSVAIAVDEIVEPSRVERYFGANLLRRGILPVQIIVSNHGTGRIRVRPSDVLLLEDERVLDPLPVEQVLEVPRARGLILTGETAARLERLYQDLAFRETVVEPDASFQGVMFFDVGPPDEPRYRSRFFRLASLFLRPDLLLHVVITDLDARKRIRFGPFGIVAGPSRGI